ncbi:MAG: site-2 protease family protein, partial [Halalkalicoccus sp.]|nr:site-2 protease family protein [Halalkalicoccus sp.]
MFKSFRIGSLFGIPIKLDVSFLLILPIFAWLIGAQIELLVGPLNAVFGTGLDAADLTTGYRPWLLGLAAALGLFAGVILHELGHSLVAIRYGFPIDSITLWIFGGLAQLSEQPEDWKQELLIAIAGPIVSVFV